MVRAANCMVLLCLCLAPIQAAAQLIGSCTIVVHNQGTLKNNPAITVLGSKQAGGSPVAATITPNSLVCSLLNLIDCYSVSAPAPASFVLAPGNGGANVGFASVFRLNGGSELPGNTPVKVQNGTHQVQVDLTATKSSGVFTAGDYRAELLLRCE